MLPAGILLVVIVGIPVIFDVYLSFLNVNISTLSHWLSAPFAGISNFVKAWTQPSAVADSAVQSLLVSIRFSVLATLIITPAGVAVALALNHRFRGRGLLRSLFLVPYALPTFVVAIVARIMFLNGTGVVDRALSTLGLASRNTYWLLGPHTFWAMLATEAWATWPFIYVMVVAGLSTVSSELYDAADIDGANTREKIRYVVFPGIRPLLLLGMLLSTVAHLGNFTLPFILFGSPPPSTTDVLPVDIYFRAFTSFQYSIAGATALVMIVVLAVPGYVYLRATRMMGREER